jgi:hypothetical protein
MDPYIARLIRLGERAQRELSTAPDVSSNSTVVQFDAAKRRMQGDGPNDPLFLGPRRSLQKEIGLALGTVRYTSGARTFLLVTRPVTTIDQRELLEVDLLMAETDTRDRRRRAGRGDAR